MGTAKETHSAAQGTPGEGRFYRPPSEAPADDTASAATGPEGRFYLPDGESSTDRDVVGDPAAQTLAEAPIEQAGLMAGEPPSREEVRAAKADQKAADKQAASGTTTATLATAADPAAETVQPDPIGAAGDLAQDPPDESVKKPPRRSDAKKTSATPTVKKAAAKKSASR